MINKFTVQRKMSMFAFSLWTIEIETIQVTGNYPLLTDQYEFINT